MRAVGRLVAAVLSAFVLALAIFTNRLAIAQRLWPALALWLVLLIGLGFVLRRRPSAIRRVPSIALGALLLSLVTVGTLTGDAFTFRRCLLQAAIVCLPLLAALHARDLARRWRELLLSLVSLGVAAGALHLLGPVVLRDWILVNYNVDVDHRPIPNKNGSNADGLWSSRQAADFRAEDLSLVMLGDSFTANRRVPEEQRWPSIVERLLQERAGDGLRVRVANFGWVSSCPVLQARQLRQIGAKYKPDWVVQVLDMTDFGDDLKASARLARRGLGGEITIWQALHARLSMALGIQHAGRWIASRVAWPCARRREKMVDDDWYAVRQPLAESAPPLEVSWRAILETRDQARRLGARYVLMVVPRYQHFNAAEAPDDPGRDLVPVGGPWIFEPFRFLEAKATEADFPIHSLLPDFQARGKDAFPVCFRDDGHWNVNGNRVAAEAVAAYLVTDGVLGQ